MYESNWFQSPEKGQKAEVTGEWRCTFLFIVVVCLEITDLMFAVDSVGQSSCAGQASVCSLHPCRSNQFSGCLARVGQSKCGRRKVRRSSSSPLERSWRAHWPANGVTAGVTAGDPTPPILPRYLRSSRRCRIFTSPTQRAYSPCSDFAPPIL